MGHREHHHTLQNPTELQEYLTNISNHSTNPESHGWPLKTHQEGAHGPAQDTGRCGVKRNRISCILASEEATRRKGDTKNVVLPHVLEGWEAWQGTLSPAPRSSKPQDAVIFHSTALT